MKVLIAIETIPYTSETFVLNHIKGLIDAKFDVKICALNKPDNQIRQPVFIEYKLENLTTYKPKLSQNYFYRILKGSKIFYKCFLVNARATLQSLNFFKYGVKALKLIYLYEMSTFVSKEKFDLIHCHFGTMAKTVAFYQEWGILKYPLITTFHGYDVDSPAIKNDKNFYDNVKENGRLFFVNSTYTQQRVIKLGFDKDKIVITPVPLDTSFFKKKYITQNGHNQIKKIITVARLVEFKGIEYCIRALKLLKENTEINFTYTIIGDGPLRKSLELLVKDMNLSDNIEFAGSKDQTEIREYLNSSDLFLLTGIKSSDGRQENQGLVIQEAQAMELPVIVSNIGGVSEGIIDGQTGFLVEEKNIQQIAEKIILLLSNEQLRHQMGERGRKFVESKYSIETSTKLLKDKYNTIIHAKK